MKMIYKNRRGFTTIEIMLAVLIIGLLAALAIPSIAKARIRGQNAVFISDLRALTHASETMATISGYPPELAPGVMPPTLQEYVKRIDWRVPTAIGGQWDWNFERHGFKAGIAVSNPSRTSKQMEEIDKIIDDGSLGSGVFRAVAMGYMYIVEE